MEGALGGLCCLLRRRDRWGNHCLKSRPPMIEENINVFDPVQGNFVRLNDVKKALSSIRGKAAESASV